MAQTLAVAKASFAASLIKPDPLSIPRNEITQFHQHLDELLQLSSPANIERCRHWLLDHVVSSTVRRAALSRYLMALAEAMTLRLEASPSKVELAGPSPVRMCLHVLYLLHDLFHHLLRHQNRRSELLELVRVLDSSLKSLVKPFSAAKDRACTTKLLELIAIWHKESFLSAQTAKDLQEHATRITSGTGPNDGALPTNEKGTKLTAPFMMPESHGDASVPFYDLPAATMLPHIIPNSSQPLDPTIIRPLQLTAGPAGKELTDAVQEFLANIESVYTQDNSETGRITVDIDALGQQIQQEKGAGLHASDDSYYGWSRQFCRAMRNGESILNFAKNDESPRFRDGRPPHGHDLDRGSWSGSQTPRSGRSRSLSGSYSPPSPSKFDARGNHHNTRHTGTLRNKSPSTDPRRRAAVP